MPELKVREGDKFPDFALDAYPGPEKLGLQSFNGRWLVLYFYPRDDTPGCTAEACGFRDSLNEIQKLDASVVGVSTDTPEAHKKFSNKYKLTFPLLSDPTGEFGARIGVLRDASRPTMNRVTFIIDPRGVVRKVYPKVDPTRHAEEILKDLRALMAG